MRSFRGGRGKDASLPLVLTREKAWEEALLAPPARGRQIKVFPAFNEDRIVVRVEEEIPDRQNEGVMQLRSWLRGSGAGHRVQGREVGSSPVLSFLPGDFEQVTSSL